MKVIQLCVNNVDLLSFGNYIVILVFRFQKNSVFTAKLQLRVVWRSVRYQSGVHSMIQ